MALRVEFADGSFYQNDADNDRNVLIRFRTSGAEWHSLIFFYEGLFECFIDGSIDLEGNQPIAALARLGHNTGIVPGQLWTDMLRNPLNALRQLAQERRHDGRDRAQSIRNAEFHYAQPLALFEHILGGTMGYSEGLWTDETRTLDQAKFNVYEEICRKLRLEPGMKVLEVGAGWGYMPIYMAKRYGVEVTVYNPVRRQNEYVRERFRRHELERVIELVEGDHRDIVRERDRFDRFVSIGVHEHAGHSPKQYQLWAGSIAAALKKGGVGFVSTTSLMVRERTNLLTLKYIFPGGHLPSLPDTLAAFARAGLMVVEVKNLWPHYQRTVEEWRKNFARAWPEMQKADPAVFTEKLRRTWTMYLEGTSEIFGDSLDLSHIVFTKGRAANLYPLLRNGDHDDAALVGGDQEPECYR